MSSVGKVNISLVILVAFEPRGFRKNHRNTTHTGITYRGTWFVIHCFFHCCYKESDICESQPHALFMRFWQMVFINGNCANEKDKFWLVFSNETPVNLHCTLPCFLFNGRIRVQHAYWHTLVIGAPLVQSMWDKKVGRHIVRRSGSVWKYCPLNCIYS